jgi:UDPglucose 6-dehydrogenase
MTIAVLGTGYVGLVAGVCFADAGHEVIGVDSNAAKIQTLQEGKVPFYEPGLDDLFHLHRKRMRFTGDIAEAVRAAQVIFIAVGTPEMNDGSADMEPTFRALGAICAAATESKVIVLKSTVPIGTSRKVAAFCKENSRFPMDIVNNPEFLRQGAAVEDFLKPDRIVIGCASERARGLMQELYEPFASKNGKPILFMDNTSAEMTKYAANSFLALKISFINELALLADKLGADVDSVRAGFTSDSRINPAFFNPGIGYGGSCFPKDVRALIHTGKQYDIDLKLLKAADEVNERQKTILTQRLLEHEGSLKGKTVAVWGLAFKPRTDDVRRAPSLKIIEELFLNGAAVRAFDPVATENALAATRVPFKACESALDAATDADALLIVTEWPEFRSVQLGTLKQKMKRALIFDGRNLFDPAKMKAAGLEYYGIGRQVRTLGGDGQV